MESTKQTQNEEEQGQQHSQPTYDVAHGGHYGASASLSGQGYAPVAEFYTGIWANVFIYQITLSYLIKAGQPRITRKLQGHPYNILATHH